MLASAWVSRSFNKKFKKYSQTPLASGLSGKEIAERMLSEKGIEGVAIKEGQGMLTDHYNPSNKTISLSESVYNERTVAAAAIAAHECGHAVQDATNYSFLQLRSSLVPIVSASNQVVPFLLLGGILLVNVFPALLLSGIILFAASTLFTFITLPVEYDATNRALRWLNSSNITYGKEHGMAKDALNAAARTYLVAAISSLATLLFYVMIFLGRR
jgi:Zn-dependent membrane protease YugP